VTGPAGHRDRTGARARLWGRHDARRLRWLALNFPLAWCLGEGGWERVSTGIAARQARRGAPWFGREVEHIAALMGTRVSAGEAAAICERHVAARRLESLQVLRFHRPGGWRPRTRLEGREHIEAALAAGRGALLWVGPFVFAGLMTKIALFEAGLATRHLSRFSHGGSRSRLGERLINPVQTRVEDRFLAERIAIARAETPGKAVRLITRRLAENRIVSITAGTHASTCVDVPFLDASMRLATGPGRIALSTGAPLLPAVTLREADGGFRTVIAAPLAAPAEATDPVAAMAAAYARWLEGFVPAQPEQLLWRADVLLGED
jgi:lauroyl/myristoyl acyltransferase